MQNQVYDTIIHQFVSQDRAGLEQPSQFGEYTYATNGKSGVWIRSEYLSKNYPKHSKAPNMPDYFQKSLDSGESFCVHINGTDLSVFLSTIKKEPNYAPCEVCDGSGRCECECCGNKHECSECDGTGKSLNQHGFTFPRFSIVEMLDTCFLAEDLEKLGKTAEILMIAGLNANIFWVHYNQFGSNIFEIGPLNILIRSLFPENECHQFNLKDRNETHQF